MAGLQDMTPMSLKPLIVISSVVGTPARADAYAASQPACPPPITRPLIRFGVSRETLLFPDAERTRRFRPRQPLRQYARSRFQAYAATRSSQVPQRIPRDPSSPSTSETSHTIWQNAGRHQLLRNPTRWRNRVDTDLIREPHARFDRTVKNMVQTARSTPCPVRPETVPATQDPIFRPKPDHPPRGLQDPELHPADFNQDEDPQVRLFRRRTRAKFHPHLLNNVSSVSRSPAESSQVTGKAAQVHPKPPTHPESFRGCPTPDAASRPAIVIQQASTCRHSARPRIATSNPSRKRSAAPNSPPSSVRNASTVCPGQSRSSTSGETSSGTSSSAKSIDRFNQALPREAISRRRSFDRFQLSCPDRTACAWSS